MKKHMICAAAALSAVAVLAAPAMASAATFTSALEFRDGLVGPQPPYGIVTLDELNANTVQVTVTLTDPGSLFIETGGPHNPFVFNTNTVDTVVSNTTGFTYDGRGQPATPPPHPQPATWDSTPFGLFTDRIGCCGGQLGAAHGLAGPLVFTVSNAGGLTFAGVGYTTDPVTGRLTGLGTGNHFLSNDGGWWFAADIFDGATGLTYNVAARDAFTSTGIPEPATWALMILGFGGVGAALRRRRRTFVTV